MMIARARIRVDLDQLWDKTLTFHYSISSAFDEKITLRSLSFFIEHILFHEKHYQPTIMSTV